MEMHGVESFRNTGTPSSLNKSSVYEDALLKKKAASLHSKDKGWILKEIPVTKLTVNIMKISKALKY